MAGKSKILIIGGAGTIGKFVVEASTKAGHPTFLLVRESTVSNPAKSDIIDGFRNSGVTLIHGDLNDHQSLLKAIKQVDVVISAVGSPQLTDQTKIIAAIKEAGNVKRFLPSEFGFDADRTHAVEPANAIVFDPQLQIRRAVEAEGIPYTYVVANLFDGFFLQTLSQPATYLKRLSQPRDTVPPRDKVDILGDGNAKAIFNEETDIGTYTIKAVDDPRTLNKVLYINPPGNIYSFNELISLWEKKIGKTVERIYIPKEQFVKIIQEASFPTNHFLAVCYPVFVNGDLANFEIEPSFGVEASQLYPDVKYTTVDEYLNQFI